MTTTKTHQKGKLSFHEASSQNIPSELMNKLSLEDASKQLAALKELIFNEPELNQAKINFLREEIMADRYQIKSESIASKLLESMTDYQEPELEMA